MLGNCVLALLLAAPAPAPAAPELRVREEFLAAKMAQAEGRLKESAGHFQSALAMRPEDPILEFEYAVLLQQLDLDDDARVHAMRSAGFDPNFDSAWALAGTLDLASAEKAADKDGEHADDRGGEKGRTAIARAVDELQRAHHLAPQNPSTLAALGRAELLNDRPDRARALLDEIPGLADNPGVLKIRAQADDRRGADAEAAKDYDQWVRADAGDREAVASAIEFFESRRDFKRALSLLRGLRVVDPDNVMIADRIALDRLRAGDFDGAERDARALAAARPEDRAARRTLAAALYQKGREEESVKMLRQLVEEDTDDPAAALTLALQLTSDGKDAEAVDVLQRLAKKAGENPGKTELRREIDAQIASIRYRARDLDSAKKIASASAISKDGVSDRLLGLLLQIARDEKKPQDGLEWARKAVAADPKNADDAASLAEFQIRADEAPAGRAALEKLAGSGIASDVLAAADAEQRLKNYAESARMASDALPRFAGNLDLLFRRGSALERGGRFEDAARAFEEILKVRPDDAQTLNYLGYMYAENGTHLAEARKMIEHAVELDPQNGAFLDSLGWVRFRMNDLEGAKSALRKAAQRMPSDPTVQEHLGDIQAKLGRKSEAVALWRKSLSLSPDEPEKIEKKIHEVGSSP
ncbi:MAG: tetratricopeptide repeat protein [Thermoanaerobaculia bacterium]